MLNQEFFGLRIGADDFMKKPFSREELFSHIEGLLDNDFVPRRVEFVADTVPENSANYGIVEEQ